LVLPHFSTGIDEIATMNARSSGWTVVSIEYSVLSDFELEAKKILDASGLKSFHGKEFKRRKLDSYIEFLKLIRSKLEAGPGFASCTLLGADWKSDFDAFCDRVVGGSLSSAGIEDAAIIDASKKIAAPFFTYQRLAAEHLGGGTTVIYVDRHPFYEALNSSEIILANGNISSQIPIVAALRAYGREMFPKAPEVERESIFICSDEDSFMVQAADIIGNFSTAFAFRQLGKKSKTNDAKCSVFESAFGDILNLGSFPPEVRMNGNDLGLDADAASFTFTIGEST
jgi:hypothetical protein